MQQTSFTKNSKNRTESILGQQLPCNIDAEKSVLGAVLINDSFFSQIAEVLIAEDFYLPAHKVIFELYCEITQRGRRIDLVTVQDELSKVSKLEEIGGIQYLITLQEEIPALGLVLQHANIIKEKSILRDLISSATGIITNCYAQNEENIESVLDKAEKVIFQISNKRSSENFTQLNIWLKKTFAHLSDIKSHSKGITGIATGFKKLDEMTSGLQKGDLIVVAGRPSMGKSCLAMDIASNAARNGF